MFLLCVLFCFDFWVSWLLSALLALTPLHCNINSLFICIPWCLWYNEIILGAAPLTPNNRKGWMFIWTFPPKSLLPFACTSTSNVSDFHFKKHLSAVALLSSSLFFKLVLYFSEYPGYFSDGRVRETNIGNSFKYSFKINWDTREGHGIFTFSLLFPLLTRF